VARGLGQSGGSTRVWGGFLCLAAIGTRVARTGSDSAGSTVCAADARRRDSGGDVSSVGCLLFRWRAGEQDRTLLLIVKTSELQHRMVDAHQPVLQRHDQRMRLGAS